MSEAIASKFPGELGLPGGVRLPMMPIKAGEFTMGSPASELGRNDDEAQRRVVLTKDFWLGQCPVTQGQWKAVMGANPSHFQNGDDYPVENVNWHEARGFCAKVNALFQDLLPQGYHFDLPTEAQWEYACRAGTTVALYTGRDLTGEDSPCPNVEPIGWYEGNSGGTTHAVGGKIPNAWGLYDMIGNVCEWCLDSYRKDYVADPEFLAGEDMTAPGQRIRRGGCWLSRPKLCRSAFRCHFDPASREVILGLRLALVATR